MYRRGVRGAVGMGMAVGQVHLPRETAENFIDLIKFYYPEANGSLSRAIELLIGDFIQIPAEFEKNGTLDPADKEMLFEITQCNTVLVALAKLGKERLKRQAETDKIAKNPKVLQ